MGHPPCHQLWWFLWADNVVKVHLSGYSHTAWLTFLSLPDSILVMNDTSNFWEIRNWVLQNRNWIAEVCENVHLFVFTYSLFFWDRLSWPGSSVICDPPIFLPEFRDHMLALPQMHPDKMCIHLEAWSMAYTFVLVHAHQLCPPTTHTFSFVIPHLCSVFSFLPVHPKVPGQVITNPHVSKPIFSSQKLSHKLFND